jgi:hypothetical protein
MRWHSSCGVNIVTLCCDVVMLCDTCCDVMSCVFAAACTCVLNGCTVSKNFYMGCCCWACVDQIVTNKFFFLSYHEITYVVLILPSWCHVMSCHLNIVIMYHKFFIIDFFFFSILWLFVVIIVSLLNFSIILFITTYSSSYIVVNKFFFLLSSLLLQCVVAQHFCVVRSL